MARKPLYVHIPKTGGTFLSSYLEEAYGEKINIWGHRNIYELSNRARYFKFAIIRNPFDWYVSRYFYFGRKQLAEKGVSIDSDSGMLGGAFRNKFPSFKEHLYWGAKENINGFWLSDRVRKMCYVRGRDTMNYYGTLESLDELTEVISKECGIDASISIHDFSLNYLNERKIKTNPDQRMINHNHYSDYYDDDMIKLVLVKDAEIIKRFGYSFERK